MMQKNYELAAAKTKIAFQMQIFRFLRKHLNAGRVTALN